jgi:hypothetical protein
MARVRVRVRRTTPESGATSSVAGPVPKPAPRLVFSKAKAKGMCSLLTR